MSAFAEKTLYGITHRRTSAARALTLRAVRSVMSVLSTAVASRRSGSFTPLWQFDGLVVDRTSLAGSAESSCEVLFFFFKGLQLEVVLVFGVLAICFLGQKIARQTSRLLVAPHRLAFGSQSLCIRSYLNFYHGEKKRELAVVESKKKTGYQHSLL